MTDRRMLSAMICDRIRPDLAELKSRFDVPVGTNTRHVAIDDLLPLDIASRVADAFPSDQRGFHVRNDWRERKRTSAKLDDVPPILKEVTYAIQSPEVVALCAEIAGVDDLEPDASLYAGGLSMMRRGDFLNPHIDNSHDARRNRYRRVNALYYVTPNWQTEYGGNLELWDDDVTTPVTVTSRFNRLVLMETNRSSWHSVSPVVADGVRCCVSSYYFTEASPTGAGYFHSTEFSARPEQKVRRIYAKADAKTRTWAGAVLRMGRGKAQAYTS